MHITQITYKGRQKGLAEVLFKKFLLLEPDNTRNTNHHRKVIKKQKVFSHLVEILLETRGNVYFTTNTMGIKYTRFPELRDIRENSTSVSRIFVRLLHLKILLL